LEFYNTMGPARTNSGDVGSNCARISFVPVRGMASNFTTTENFPCGIEVGIGTLI
jgi:hypothetical protein